MKNFTPTKRGADFVLNMGTKVIPDRKKKENKNFCRKFSEN